MDDSRILEMYWSRSEQAIAETQKKYGRYCHSIAYNILSSDEDAEECVNDTYLKAWGSIPPQRPNRLSAYLGKIVRNIALDRYERTRAQKRSGVVELALDELGECIPDSGSGATLTDNDALRAAINGFLATLSRRNRMIFVKRYWYLCSVADIAIDMEISESNVKVILLRSRRKFKEYLDKEGITV